MGTQKNRLNKMVLLSTQNMLNLIDKEKKKLLLKEYNIMVEKSTAMCPYIGISLWDKETNLIFVYQT